MQKSLAVLKSCGNEALKENSSSSLAVPSVEIVTLLLYTDDNILPKQTENPLETFESLLLRMHAKSVPTEKSSAQFEKMERRDRELH